MCRMESEILAEIFEQNTNIKKGKLCLKDTWIIDEMKGAQN